MKPHKERVERAFSGAARKYGSVVGFFDHWSRRLVEVADVAAGERVLDVGCGPGNAAAVAVERGASVLGFDLSAEMVAVARERVPGEAAEFEVADAESFVVAPSSYDVVVCGFVIMFVEDKAGALVRMRDALRPGGRLVLSVPDADLPTPRESKTRWMQRFGFPPPQRPDVDGLLAEVGLSLVSRFEETASFTFESGEQYLDWVRSHGGRLALDLLSGDDLEAFEREQVEAAEADRGPDGIVMETKATFWVAARE